MGRLLLVRHGETPWNAEGRIQGHSDVGLSEKGKQQASMIAGRLANVRIDAAYSSDLVRCQDTAKVILERHNIPLQTTPELRERFYGVFEGLTMAERQTRFPELFAASVINDLDFAPTDGESPRETLRRMTPVMDGIRKKHANETTLIVGHGGSLRAAIIALMALPAESTWSFVMGNCSLSVFDTYPNNTVMLLYNDTSHLNHLGPHI